jgi:superfamily II DNA/RNA helicase
MYLFGCACACAWCIHEFVSCPCVRMDNMREVLDFSQLEVLILDEADRYGDQGEWNVARASGGEGRREERERTFVCFGACSCAYHVDAFIHC